MDSLRHPVAGWAEVAGVSAIVLVGLAAPAARAEVSSPHSASSVQEQTPNILDLAIPSSLGYIVETFPPASRQPQPPVLIHIQEAHTDYDAQQHLAGILQQLAERYGVKLVLVEGGEGDVGLAYLRRYGPPENRKVVAEKYLKAGLISGEEYLDIVSDRPLVLWGVEQKDLYQKHVQAFLDVEPVQASLKPVLAAVRASLELLKPHLADPALMELETGITAFEQGQLRLSGYVDALTKLAARQGIRITDSTYPHLAQFLALRQLEADTRLEAVQQEQQALLSELRLRVSAEEIARLLAAAQRMKTDRAAVGEFYGGLQRAAGTAGVQLEPYPNLSRYLRYLAEKTRFRPSALAGELEQLAGLLRKSLAASSRSQQLYAMADQLMLMERLQELRLSPTEYQRLQAMPLDGMCAAWVGFFSEHLPAQGLPSLDLGLDRCAPVEAQWRGLLRFYEAAQARDEALVTNAIAKLHESGERVAVLITGGFHSPAIAKRLKEQGMGLVVVATKVGHDADPQHYHDILKLKNGHGN